VLNFIDVLDRGENGMRIFHTSLCSAFKPPPTVLLQEAKPLSLAPYYQDRFTKVVGARPLIAKANPTTLWYTHLDEDVGRLNSF
jgi:hypothetical protein